jgi:hypothetical protein
MRSWLIGSGRTPADLRSGAGTPEASANGQASYTVEQLYRELFGGLPNYSATGPVRPGRS